MSTKSDYINKPGVYYCNWYKRGTDDYFINIVETTPTDKLLSVVCVKSNVKEAIGPCKIETHNYSPKDIIIYLADSIEDIDLNNFEIDYAHLFI